MRIDKLFRLALVAVTFSACSNETEEVVGQDTEIRLTSEITPASRGTSLTQQSAQIVVGQQVGVTITGANTEHTNVAWEVGTNGTLTNTGDAIYYGNGDATITAYHPYNADWTGTSHPFLVKEDQSTDAGYLNSDLLWSTAFSSKTTEAVELTFTHKLAKINVILQSENIEDLSGATIYICGTKIRTYFNPSTGEFIKNAAEHVNEIKAGVTTATAKNASAIIIPQTIAANTKLIKVVHNGKTYYYSLSADKEFKEGKSYSYTLTVKEALVEVSASENITNWEDEENTGNAEETAVFTTSTAAEMPLQDSEGTYLISSASNLKWFMDNCKYTSEIYTANYKLTTDIYFDKDCRRWISVSFAGTFDGGNHVLENMKLDSNDSGYGFFSSMSGTVKNLVFKNPTIDQTGDYDYYGLSSGVLAAKASGTIINCGVIGGKVSVASTSRARVNGGGLIGAAFTGAIIKGCYVIGTIIQGSGNTLNPRRLGGLIGSVGDTSSAKNINITSCYTKDITISGNDGCTMGTFIGDTFYLDTYSVISGIAECYYDNLMDAIGRSGSSSFTINTFEALTTDNFAAAIEGMNAKLTDCDYIFGEDGLFVKQ